MPHRGVKIFLVQEIFIQGLIDSVSGRLQSLSCLFSATGIGESVEANIQKI